MRKLRKSPENIPAVLEEIERENLVCMPTDTLYGIVGKALSPKVYSRIYEIKGRNPQKPLIVLFDSLESAERLGVFFPHKVKEKLSKVFPERLTVVLPLKESSPLFKVLRRKDVAIRVPKDEFLLKLLSETGPLFAPSANPEGMRPAEDCRGCEDYFKDEISVCLEGESLNLPSTLVSLLKGRPELLREGAFPFEKLKEVLGE